MDEMFGVQPVSCPNYDQVIKSPIGNPPPLLEPGERSGVPAISFNDKNLVHHENFGKIQCDSMIPSTSFVNHEQNMEIMYPVMTSVDKHGYSNETTCEHCGTIISNNHDAIVSHLQQCTIDVKPIQTMIEKQFISNNMTKSVREDIHHIDPQLYQMQWERYLRKLHNKMAADYNFSNKSFTFDVPGLDIGMKLEALDRNNPQSFCVATVVEILGHRVRIRYDGYGQDDSNDFWCNFQADELYPIGWCAQNAYPLQPPTGIQCTLEDWRRFLTKTLTGALAAPKHLFPLDHTPPKVHSFEIGMKLEVIHPTKPYIICPATVVKSLGPYYFLVATELCENIPDVTMCCHSDSSNIFPAGWSYRNGIDLTVPLGYTKQSFTWDKYLTTCRAICAPQNLFRKVKAHKFRTGQKLEAVDLEHPRIIRVATITNVMGRVLQLFFDGQTRFQFIECDSPDIHGFGWCKRTGHPLITPYGQMPFKTSLKYEGLESGSKPLKLISFDEVVGRKSLSKNDSKSDHVVHISRTQTSASTSAQQYRPTPSLPQPSIHRYTSNAQFVTQSTPPLPESSIKYPHNHPTSYSPPPYTPKQDDNQQMFNTSITYSPQQNPESGSNSPTYSPPRSFSQPLPPTVPSMLATSGSDETLFEAGVTEVEKSETISHTVPDSEGIGEDKEKCPTLSPSDDDEDLSDEDVSGTGSERFYHNKNQIYFNKYCCCGPLLNPDEVKLLPQATEPGKVSAVIRIALGMVAKCAKDPEKVMEMMQEGTGVRLSIEHNGKTYKKAISRVDSRPKLERYLKRFCRRLVCCEYFLSLTPPTYPCPDDCKTDQFGNLQGPKGMKAKRAREYFEAKRSGHEKKKRGRKPKIPNPNDATTQRAAAAGIVTSVFPKGNQIPPPNLNLPVPAALTDHVRNTTTKVLHQIQASQAMLQDHPSSSMTVTQAQTTVNSNVSQLGSTSQTFAHSVQPEVCATKTHSPHCTTSPPTSLPTSLPTTIPTYGKPRILPSPYGPPPVSVTLEPLTVKEKPSRPGRPPNLPPKKIIRPIMPAVEMPYIEIHIPKQNKLILPSRSKGNPVTTVGAATENTTTMSGKPVFQLAPAKLKSFSKSTSGYSGRLVAVPCTFATGVDSATSLVTSNKRPIPASSLHNQPPPLIPARDKLGNAGNKTVQVLRPSYIEGKLVAASPNVCVTERGTFVATQLNKSSVPSSGASVVNHVVGQSADANVMMNRMFSVVKTNEENNGTPTRSHAPPQVAHVQPSVRNSSVQINDSSNLRQQAGGCDGNANNYLRHTGTIQCDKAKKSVSNTHSSVENANTAKGSANVEAGSTVEATGSRLKKFSFHVGSGMGAVTSVVRSGKHMTPTSGTVRNEDNLGENCNPSTLANVSDRMTNRVVINPNISEHITNLAVSEMANTAVSERTLATSDTSYSEKDPLKDRRGNALSGHQTSKTHLYQKSPKKVRFVGAQKDSEGLQRVAVEGKEHRETLKRGYEEAGKDRHVAYLHPSNNDVVNSKKAKRSSDLPLSNGKSGTSDVTNSSQGTCPKADIMKGVHHAVQSSQHPSVKLRPPGAVKQHSTHSGFPNQAKRQRIHYMDRKKVRSSFGIKSSHSRTFSSHKKPVYVNASTNTSFPGCSGNSCPYHSENPRLWTIEDVGEYIRSTDCKNYASYFMDQEIDGESLLMLTRSTLMQFTNMKLGPTMKLSNYIAQLRARVGMSKMT